MAYRTPPFYVLSPRWLASQVGRLWRRMSQPLAATESQASSPLRPLAIRAGARHRTLRRARRGA